MKYGRSIQSRVFNYNFAVPKTVTLSRAERDYSDNILNINNTLDPVTTDLPKDREWTWARHGSDIDFTKAGDPNSGFFIWPLEICLGHHRAELYQREVIRNESFTPSALK